ncbi:MAG: sensor domain-containing protein [Halobellus sp.]|uniref:sensor domain-containing protein n=1 Tax=Halobellus sp. TaxID=1979212 RepID=UPI0035D432C6
MPDAVARLRSSLPRPSLRTVVTTPFRLRTYGNLLYLLLAFPLGLGYFIFLSVGLSVSIGLSFILLGIPLFLIVLATSIAFVTFERRLARVLLGTEIESPPWRVVDADGLLDGMKRLVSDPALWLGLGFLATKLVVGVIAFTLLVGLLVPAFAVVATPLYYDNPGVRVGVFLPTELTRELSLYIPWNELLVGVSFVVRLSSWQVTSLVDAVAMSIGGILAVVLVLAILDGFAWLCGQWARLLLGKWLIARFQ